MNASLPSHPQIPGKTELKAWLETVGLGGAKIQFLTGDASFRTYYRVTNGSETKVLMVAPPEFEKPQEYVEVTRLLEAAGVRVPHIYHADTTQGFIVLEDFGDKLFSKCLRDGHSEQALYEGAMDVLIHLHNSQKLNPNLPFYDLEKFLEEACVFLEWTYPKVTGHAANDEVIDSFVRVWTEAFNKLPPTPQGLVLRDYMVDNIMLLGDGQSIESFGLLDFQDALWGDVVYDVVSLLEDARRDVSPELAAEMKGRYLKAFPDIDQAAFEQSYYVWGAQRSTKILGIFTRLAERDKKTKYLEHLPRVWRIVEEDFKHPALGQVKAWFDELKMWKGF